ncbi:MAG: phosphotransferase [Planctomycetota bacterium]
MLEPLAGTANLSNVEVLTGGLANTNLKVKVANTGLTCVIRIYTREQPVCEREVNAMEFVRSETKARNLPRVPVPRVFFADPNGSLTGYPYAVVEYVEGVTLAEALQLASENDLGVLGTLVGRAAAALSHLRLPWCGELGPSLELVRDWGTPLSVTVDHIRRCVQSPRAGRRMGTQLRRRLWRYIETNASELQVLEDAYSLLHGDFKPQNIIVSRERDSWELAAIVDWELACAGPPLADLGTLLRRRSLHDDAFACGVAAAFQENGGTLPQNWRRLARLLDLNAMCTFLDHRGERPHVFADAVELIEHTLDDNERSYAR